MWFKQYHNTREKHYHVMKIHLLSPFLFGLVYTEDKVSECVNKGLSKKSRMQANLTTIRSGFLFRLCLHRQFLVEIFNRGARNPFIVAMGSNTNNN